MGFLRSIAIDGPAGAGKSTAAKGAAKKHGWIYVDTGAMYRAMALYLLRNGIDPDDEERLSEALTEAVITIEFREGQQRVILNGEDVTSFLRTEEVGNMASVSSANPHVREKLVALQQKLAAETSVVMDGRDIGTVVLPDAGLKIYLTASVDVRAERRFQELTEKGGSPDLEEIKRDIEERDYRDSHREHSPLRQAEDAVLLDSSYLTIEETIDAILKLAEERFGTERG